MLYVCVCELRDCEGCGSTLKEIGGAEQRPWQLGMLQRRFVHAHALAKA